MVGKEPLDLEIQQDHKYFHIVCQNFGKIEKASIILLLQTKYSYEKVRFT